MATYDELISLALKSKGSFDLQEDELVSFVKAGAVRAYKAADSTRINEDVQADFNVETKKLRLSIRKKVVDTVTDTHTECTAEEGKVAAGEFASIEIVDEGTYKAIDAAVSAMRREIEASWNHANTDLIKYKFQEMKGECLPAQVLTPDSIGSIGVAINTLDALLPAQEQIPGETFHEGQTILVLVKDLVENANSSSIIVSRIDPKVVMQALKLHIPEVDTGNIEVKGIARIPGKCSRIAVFSSDMNAVERCEKRTEKIKEETGKEDIQFIEWYEDSKAFIVSSLQVEAREVLLIEGEKQALVEVFNDSAEKSLDANGQLKKLAEELTGYKIEIKLVPRDAASELPGV